MKKTKDYFIKQNDEKLLNLNQANENLKKDYEKLIFLLKNELINLKGKLNTTPWHMELKFITPMIFLFCSYMFDCRQQTVYISMDIF